MRMGEKYAVRGFNPKSLILKHKAKVVLPLCILLVLVVWNSPTVVPFENASSGPPDLSVAGQHQVMSSQYLAVRNEGPTNDGGRTEDDSVSDDNLKTQLSIQKSYEDALSAVGPKEKFRTESIELKAEIGIEQITDRESENQNAAQERPSESEEARPQRYETAEDRTNEGRSTDSNVETNSEEVPAGSEIPSPESNEQSVDYSRITGNRNDEVNKAIWRKWEQARSPQLPYYTRKENFNNEDGDRCEGKQIYVYDLPAEFNADIAARCATLFPWHSLCDFFTESGRGVPVNTVEDGKQIMVPGDKWFNTHQYALELVSHARILKYKCRTYDPNQAKLFYIPYYAGLDVIRWHFHPNATNEKRDELATRLVRWLEQQAPWRKSGGRDHVLVLGKISWDFRRQDSEQWGNRLLLFPEMQQTTKLLIERDPWATNDIGVPHPTYFHPSSSSDIDTWLRHAHSQWRKSLVTFVGAERKNDPTNVRTALVEQCRNSTDCEFVDCEGKKCLEASFIVKAFLSTNFCMQPVGDSPTRRSVFDSLIAGCIPVLFHPCTAYVQYPWHLPANESSWSVYISEDEIRAGRANVIEILSKISRERRNAMRQYIINNVIPGLLYSAPGSDISPYRDAFDITIDQLLYRVKHRPADMDVPDPPAMK